MSKDFDIGSIISEVTQISEGYKLKIKKKKTRIMYPHNRMVVTGVVINEKLSIPKWKWRNFRAKLHNIIVNDEQITMDDYQKLRGFAEWIYSLHTERGNIFKDELNIILTNNVSK